MGYEESEKQRAGLTPQTGGVPGEQNQVCRSRAHQQRAAVLASEPDQLHHEQHQQHDRVEAEQQRRNGGLLLVDANCQGAR